MGVAKIIEITAESDKSFEDAINMGVAQASQSVEDIQGAWIKELKVVVENGKVTGYRVDMKVTFLFHE